MNTERLSIKANMLWNSFGSAISLLCNYLISILVVRLSAGFEAAGLYSLAMAVANTVLPIAVFCSRTYQVSDVNKEYTAGEYFTFRIYTSILAIGLGMVGTILIGRIDAIVTIGLFLIYKMVTLVIDVFHGVDQKHYRMDIIGKSLIIQGVSSLLIFLVVFWVSNNLNLALLFMSLGIILIALVYDLPQASSMEIIQFNLPKDRALRLFKTCIPLVFSGFIFSLTAAFPREFVSATMGDEIMGAYSSIAMPVAIIQMSTTYIYLPLISYFSDLFSKGDNKGIALLFAKTFLGILVMCFVCMIGVRLLGGPVLKALYGPMILDYLYLLGPLVFYAVITGIMWFLKDLLIAFRNFRSTVFAGCFALIVLLVVIRPCSTYWGLNGVTFASVLSCLSCVGLMMTALIIQLKK